MGKAITTNFQVFGLSRNIKPMTSRSTGGHSKTELCRHSTCTSIKRTRRSEIYLVSIMNIIIIKFNQKVFNKSKANFLDHKI